MTEKEKPKGIPGYPPPNPEDLPEEERWQLDPNKFRPDDELIYGQTGPQKGEDDSISIVDGSSPATEKQEYNLLNEGAKNYRYYAQFDTYNIEMRDGSMQKFKRIPIPEMEYEELEDMRAQIDGRMNMQGKALTAIQVRNLEKLWFKKLGEYYLINVKTNKPMTEQERKNVKRSYEIHGILKSCLLRSNMDAPEGKK